MGKKEQAPALAIFVQGSLWVWSATSRGRPPDGGLALAVFHMVPRVPAAPNLFVHPPADLRKVLLPPSSRPARLLRLTVFCPASSGDGSSIVGRGRRPPRASSQRSLGGRCRLLRLPSPRLCPVGCPQDPKKEKKAPSAPRNGPPPIAALRVGESLGGRWGPPEAPCAAQQCGNGAPAVY